MTIKKLNKTTITNLKNTLKKTNLILTEAITNDENNTRIFMVEDRQNYPDYKTAPWLCPFDCDITFTHTSCSTTLTIYLPRTHSIQAILSLLEHPSFTTNPTLKLESNNIGTPQYAITLTSNHHSPYNIKDNLKHLVQSLPQITTTLYQAEQSDTHIPGLTHLLAEHF